MPRASIQTIVELNFRNHGKDNWTGFVTQYATEPASVSATIHSALADGVTNLNPSTTRQRVNLAYRKFDLQAPRACIVKGIDTQTMAMLFL